MMQIWALCYSNIFMYRKDLKAAILAHHLWNPGEDGSQPIFELYLSDFIAAGKKTKMIFISAEQSKAKETLELFKKLYDGSPKAYPNGYMMLFIPLMDGDIHSTEFRSKILYNHDQYVGEESAFSIGGFQDIKTSILLKAGNKVSLRALLKSIPASNGMSRPQLYQHVEPNISGVVMMVTLQKQDLPLLLAQQNTL